ncbi:MAG TPA: 4Fe-4S dicluster domain-containing protein [Gemmatimonadaceae bacterium]|nr:4Fe-4S dicluster domain-containing protein [Gemmatimonadaceae bacterium]
MTRWAWVIDQTRCIGCHACTTACKSENEVPVGVFRTWVKNVEVGTFPDVKRHFAVLRCNHCAEPPCVDVCPVTAMYQRPDGLVDFDHEACIGCKACMQACPYDAIYMDPESHTAAKCNFCSHRVDEGLLPACVVVCPEEALLFGDLDDPTSKVRRVVGDQVTTVRRPEQGTRPQAYYIGAHSATLDPLAARHDATYMWSERGAHDHRELVPLTRRSTPQEPARVAYDVPRQRAWGWPVSSYIWTKGIAAGLGILAGLSRIVDLGGARATDFLAPLIALAFLTLTGALLVGDLKRPERFWTILTRPQWKSWLARGAFIITAYGASLVAWIVLAAVGAVGALIVVAPVVVVLAALTAAYTAWLFGQCEARDLWQSRLLLPHLLLHALGAGSAVLMIVVALRDAQVSAALRGVFLVAVLGAGAIALADALGRHRTANGAAAARALVRGSPSRLFWIALAIGVVLPALLVFAGVVGAVVAAVFALAGWWLHGHAFVLAGQGPPIS